MVFWIASHVPEKASLAHDGQWLQSRRQSGVQLTNAPPVEPSGQVAPLRSAPSHCSSPSATPLPQFGGRVVEVVVDEGVRSGSLQSMQVAPSLGSQSSPLPGSTFRSPQRDACARTSMRGRPLACSLPVSVPHWSVIFPAKRALLSVPHVFHLACN